MLEQSLTQSFMKIKGYTITLIFFNSYLHCVMYFVINEKHWCVSVLEKVWHMGAVPSKFAPGLRQNSAGNGHQTLEKREWQNEPIRAGPETFSSNQNSSSVWTELDSPLLSWETGDCSNSVEMAPVNQCSPVQYFRIHSFQVEFHSHNSKDRSFARRRCLFKLSQLQSRWQTGQVSVCGLLCSVLRFIVTSA